MLGGRPLYENRRPRYIQSNIGVSRCKNGLAPGRHDRKQAGQFERHLPNPSAVRTAGRHHQLPRRRDREWHDQLFRCFGCAMAIRHHGSTCGFASAARFRESHSVDIRWGAQAKRKRAGVRSTPVKVIRLNPARRHAFTLSPRRKLTLIGATELSRR